MCRGSNGWGRMRRDSNLAELGITAAEFEEFTAGTAKRPRRDDNAAGDLAGASLAMGMDVDPAVAGAGARSGNARPRNGAAANILCLPHRHADHLQYGVHQDGWRRVLTCCKG